MTQRPIRFASSGLRLAVVLTLGGVGATTAHPAESLPTAGGGDAVLPRPATPAPAPAATQEDWESLLAKYLVNFARYVRWPAAVLPDGAPIRVGFLNDPATSDALEKLVVGRAVGGHPLEIVRAPFPERLATCHIILLNPDDATGTAAALHATAGKPVLVVLDRPLRSAAPESGVAIEMHVNGKRATYVLFLEALKARGMKPSPDLLRYATVPGGRP